MFVWKRHEMTLEDAFIQYPRETKRLIIFFASIYTQNFFPCTGRGLQLANFIFQPTATLTST